MKEQKRLANREEQHFWLANAFYCFYFPLVCRRKPVTNDDVYECHTVDKCELKVKHSTDYWDKHVNKYMKAMNEWKQKQSENPGKKIKQPRKPFMLWMLLFGVGTRLLLLGQLLFFSSTILIVVQPLLMRELLKAVNNKQTNPYTSFPYASAIFIALFQFLSQLFLGWAQRHTSVGIVALFAHPSLTITIFSIQIISIFFFSLQISILIPLIFVFYDIGATTLIALAVILLVMIPIIYFSSKMAKSIKKYLGSNDIRNKITNETIQGIRVVKYSGLENIFINRIKQTRLPQCWNSFHYTFHVQCVAAFTRCIDPLINAATIPTYTFTKNIQQSDFPLDVMPNLSFINQMARECRFIPQYIQGILMIVVGLQRIQEFLFLPEISREIHEQPNDSENVALIIENGFFGWGDPIKIPLTVAEKSKMKKEMEKRRKQQKIEENKNKDNKDINDGNNGLQYNGMESEHEKQLISQLTQNQNLISSKTDSPQQEVFSSNKQNNSSFPEPIVSPFEIPSPSISSSPSQINNQIPINESSNQEDLKQEQNKKKKKIHLQDINMKLKKGSLTMIIGGVGSGKSSLGSAIIGDIERQSGEIKSIGTIAYCPQTPWINNNTVQGNIIFGNQYDEQKYNEIVRICALEPDFQTLPAGDQTAIGEKGVNLSGGQKARIQLARAVYSDRDIYILDDPLSAVDAHVGRHLFEECIDERADNIILIKGGRVRAQGSYSELNQQGIDFNQYIIKNQKDEQKIQNQQQEENIIELENNKQEQNSNNQQQTNEVIKVVNEISTKTGKQILSQEEFETKSTPWMQYWIFYCTLLSPIFRIIYPILILIIEFIVVGQSWWLGIVGSTTTLSQISYEWKIIIYALAIVALFICLFSHALMSAFMQKRSNQIIHNKLINSILKAPSSFFDTTPMGRILNRLTGDLTMVDQQLFNLFTQVVMLVFGFVGQVIIIAINTPIFIAFGVPVLIYYYIVCQLYQHASRQLQRIESISKSPIFSLYSETVSGAGLSTIRAFKLEDTWRKKFFNLCDQWAIRFELYMLGNPWVQLYCSIASALMMLSVVILGWFYMSPAVLSVAIMASLSFQHLGGNLIQQSTFLKSQMTSFGRILFYTTKLPQEIRRSIDSVKVKKNWPKSGKIQFDNVSFRYRSGLPYVLNNVNFTFKGGEKIGVCGRTGAGKSSLLFPLFRLIELDPKLQPTMIDVNTGFPIEPDPNEEPNKGRILIDGIDISKVYLSRVRRSIAIIPQDPTLFTGTLRYNLDIANKCNDDRIWEVLQMVEMRDVIINLPLGLDTQVAEGGSNFSTGQRQLICFGRAILNNCRIVVMDEATASVDVETDAKIQRTIREQFVDKTVIVIAHRLNTIMNSDRIMVMSDGRVAEIDKPKNLLADENSALNKLVKSLQH